MLTCSVNRGILKGLHLRRLKGTGTLTMALWLSLYSQEWSVDRTTLSHFASRNQREKQQPRIHTDSHDSVSQK